MSKVRKFIRQGEIYLEVVQLSDVPKNYLGKQVKSAMLGLGETGNAHVLKAQATAVEDGFNWLFDASEDISAIEKHGESASKHDLFIELFVPAYVDHSDRKDGHEELVVPEKVQIVRIVTKREQMWFNEEVRRIAD